MDAIIDENKKSWLQRFILWREKKIKEKHFILILSFLAGIFTALAAWFLKFLVEWIKEFLTENFDSTGVNWLYLVYPVFGIFLTGLFIRYIVKDDISHGVTKILYAISRRQSRIKRHNTWSSVIASAITIGFGGSVGAEAPIVLTGSAIGSNLGSVFKMEHKTLMLLVGCGAAGAVAGIFKAPIAGIVFTMEVLMLDLTMASLVPLMFTAITSYVVTFFLMGDGFVFSYQITDKFVMANFPYYVILGIFAGVLSVYFVRMNLRVEQFLGRIKQTWKRIAIGGALLGVIIFVFPPLYGEGYTALDDMMAGHSDKLLNNTYFFGFRGSAWMMILFVVGLIFVKVIATALTNGSGGVGGVFAPSLFTGGVAGYLLAMLINMSGIRIVEPSHFVLAGMAGTMSGVMKAPLTAMFLIAEISGGYALFLPLMLTSVISYLTSQGMEPYSIYARRLAMQGDLLTHNKDKAVLTLMKLDKVVETDFKTIEVDATLGDLVKVVSKSSRNLFPVLNSNQQLLGIVLLDDIRKVMFNQELYSKTYVRDFMTTPSVVIDINDSMEVVMKKFEDSKAWNLPVLQDHKYIGFVSKAKIFNTYRKVLIHFSDDE